MSLNEKRELENQIANEVEDNDVETGVSDDETLDETTDKTVDDEEVNQEPETKDTNESEDGEVVIMVDGVELVDEEVEEEGKPWIKELRRKKREQSKELNELKEKIKSLSQQVEQYEGSKEVALGAKPTLADCDYEEEEFVRRLEIWTQEKTKKEQQDIQRQAKIAEDTKAWQQKLQNFKKSTEKLGVKDYTNAQDTVAEVLNVTQQGIIISGADNPALVVYSIGKQPELAKRLSKIEDPVKFAVEIGKLETKLKVTVRKPPPPEKVLRSDGGTLVSSDSTLEKLRRDAEKTGDFSKVIAYKSKLQK